MEERKEIRPVRSYTKIKEELTGRIKNSFSGFLRVCLVGLLVVLQIALIILLPIYLNKYNFLVIYMYLIIEILSILVTFSLVNDNRSPSYKIAWICIALVLPISGHIMYVLWGKPNSNKTIERKVRRIKRHGLQYVEHKEELMEEYKEKYPTQYRMCKYMDSENFPLFKNNKIDYFAMGEEAFEVIFEDLENAKKFILVNFFIVAEGAIWDKLHEILVRKRNQGIEVKFMYDDFGAMLRTEKDFRKKLEEEGIEVQVFNPIHRYTEKLYMNYRSHQKIVVIDGNIGYTGGFNIADEYANLVNRFGVWKDNGVRVEGEAVWGLTITFLQMWEVCMERTGIDFNHYRPNQRFEPSEVYCHVISDGPDNNPNNPIENVYRQMIHYAGEFLYITTPYLIIEDDMKQALITAVKSGVDVRIITPLIPDKKRVKMLTNYNYGELLKHGVRIFEYMPGFIHAKTILNESCGIVGTINMDYRSFYLHYENGLWMSNEIVVGMIKADLARTMKESIEITYEDWKNRPLTLKWKQAVLNIFSTLM